MQIVSEIDLPRASSEYFFISSLKLKISGYF